MVVKSFLVQWFPKAFQNMVRGYPPLIFPHLGDPYALTTAQHDENAAYVRQVMPDRIAAIRALLCQLGAPMPEIYDDWYAKRAMNSICRAFSAAIPQDVFDNIKTSLLTPLEVPVIFNNYYQPFAGPATMVAALMDFCLMIDDMLKREGVFADLFAYHTDEKGRSQVGRGNYGELFWRSGSKDHPCPLMVNASWHSCYRGDQSWWHVQYKSSCRTRHWEEMRLRDPSAGYDIVGRDMTISTLSDKDPPKGLPFAKPTRLRALTREEAAIQAKAWADYPAFWRELAPKTERLTKPAAEPKIFRFPKVWKEKGAYTHDLSRYTPPNLSGHTLWWDPDKYDSLHRKVLAILPERCDIITALLRDAGITAAATAESWDQIGDWLTRVIEPNREGKAPDVSWLDDDLIHRSLFRPLHYALLTDISLLFLQHFSTVTGGKIVEAWQVENVQIDDLGILVAYAPVQRRVLDSLPPRDITDGIAIDVMKAVFPYITQHLLKELGSEWVEEWIAENSPPRFLGDPFRALADLRTTPWEEGRDPAPSVLQAE